MSAKQAVCNYWGLLAELMFVRSSSCLSYESVMCHNKPWILWLRGLKTGHRSSFQADPSIMVSLYNTPTVPTPYTHTHRHTHTHTDVHTYTHTTHKHTVTQCYTQRTMHVLVEESCTWLLSSMILGSCDCLNTMARPLVNCTIHICRYSCAR